MILYYKKCSKHAISNRKIIDKTLKYTKNFPPAAGFLGITFGGFGFTGFGTRGEGVPPFPYRDLEGGPPLIPSVFE